jgi:hypothetical protein
MKHIDDLFKQVSKLWDHGEFIRSAYIDDKGISLYKLDGQYYLIWYTSNNTILKYEVVLENEIEQIFFISSEFKNHKKDSRQLFRRVYKRVTNYLRQTLPIILNYD